MSAAAANITRALGERRADAVAEILRIDGVSSIGVSSVMAKNVPLTWPSDDAHAQNRRAEFLYEAK